MIDENAEIIRKDGAVISVAISASVLYLENRTVIQDILRNCTERKKAEDSLRASETRYRKLFESTRDGILILEAETGLIIDVNPSLVDLLGLSREDLTGRKLSEIEVFKDSFSNKTRFEELLQKGSINYEHLILKTPNNRKVYAEFVSNIYDGSEQNVIQCNIRDITERLQAEAQTIEMETLERTNRAKSDLLANVSHELRTPLTSIKGFIETLIEPDVDWSKTQQLEFLRAANVETERLTLLIHDLLDMSRIDSGKMVLDKRIYQISEILRSAEAVLSAITAKHHLQQEIAQGIKAVKADKMRLTQVITNLVENAAKFSPENSDILIEANEVEDFLVISVADQGIGISPQCIGNLFNRFYQVQQAVTSKTRGTGLGLVICKGIIDAHEGKIWVESEEGKGSKFSFSIPISTL